MADLDINLSDSPKAHTMAEVAAEAGVSKMAVSLALRGSPRVSKQTRQHILSVAERLNYRPNPLVQTLMANLRTTRAYELRSTLAWITAFDTKDGWRAHRVHKQYYQGVIERAHKLGYRIEPIWAFSKGMSGARLSQVLQARGIQGVIIPPVGSTKVRLELDWENFSCATIGYTFKEPKLHRSAANLHDAMSLALATCTNRGYNRIGFVIPAITDDRVNHAWMASFLAWQRFIPRKSALPMLYTDYNYTVEEKLEAWIKKHQPEVILSPNNEFMRWLPALGLKIPEDIGFVSLNSPQDSDLLLNVAGIDQNDQVIGAMAVDLVISQLQHNEIGLPAHPKVVLTEGKWKEGTSIRPSAESPTRASVYV